MNSSDTHFAPFAVRMEAADLPDIFIKGFAEYYRQLRSGETGQIPEADILPIETLPDAEHFPPEYAEAGEAVLGRTVNIKLNGGLGTGMGLEKAKSLLIVKDTLSFLEIIARQAQLMAMPLILMNSFRTEADSMAALVRFGDEGQPAVRSFIQHKEPKVDAKTLEPVSWPRQPDLEWCPPGHGDVYTAMVTSETLDQLLAGGYEYALVSNADNLGAVIDRSILGYFAQSKLPFLMEVADRTAMDKKGGHLARRPAGQLVLRDLAQCPAADHATFQDIKRHKYFNTNNLWFHLPTLKHVLEERAYQLGLPMIRNLKTVDPREASSTAVYQLETSMGSAISVFDGAQAIRVPRTRFAPVKTTNDLLLVRSDAYALTEDFRVIPNPLRQLGALVIVLDNRYYKLVTDLDARFSAGTPSLLGCSRLEVTGDVSFGANIVCEGVVTIINESGRPQQIADDSVLSGKITFS